MVVSDGNKAYPLDSYSKIAKIKVGEVENDVVLGLKRDGYGYIDGGPEAFKQYLVTYSIPDDAHVRKLKSDEARVSVAKVRAVDELRPIDNILPDVLESGIRLPAISLQERLTFDQLFKLTDNGRIDRANTQVRGPALEVESAQDSAYYFFNVKSFPSTTGLRHRGYIRFFKPRMANPNQYQALEKLDVMVDCTCFGPDTPVMMADGTFKAIADVRVGDRVFTHTGRIQRVISTQSRQVRADEKVFEMRVEGFPQPMVVTGEHPVYTLRGNNECLCGCGKSLVNSGSRSKNRAVTPDYVLGRKYHRGHYRSGDKLPDKSAGVFEWTEVAKLRDQEWFLSPWLAHGTDAADVDFARLVGYYAAEGCIPNERGHAVRLTFNLNETDTLVADVLRICAKLGYLASAKKANPCKNRPVTNWVNVTIRDAGFRAFVITNVGQGSKDKRLSSALMSWNTEALWNLYLGATLGDGWIDPKGRVTYMSSSVSLAQQFYCILGKLQVQRSIRVHQNYGPNGEVLYGVGTVRGASTERVMRRLRPYLRDKDLFTASDKEVRRLEYARNEGELRGLRKCAPSDYAGTVYDLTVEDDHSYVACGIAVHNCQDYRYRFAWANKQRQSGIVGPQSLNQAHNRAPRITNPSAKPSLCKHLASCKDYIYGAQANFPQGDSEPNILNKLTRYATKRWLDIGGAMAQGRAREAAYKAAVQTARRTADRPEARPTQLPLRAGEVSAEVTDAGSFLEQLEERAIAQNEAVAAAEALPAVTPQGSATTPAAGVAPPIPSNTAESVVFTKNTKAIMRSNINPLKLIEEVIEDETEALDAAEAEDTSIALPPPGGPAGDPADEGSEALDILRDIRDGIQTLVSVEAGDEEGEEEPKEEDADKDKDKDGEEDADSFGVDFAPESDGPAGDDEGGEGEDRDYSFGK